MFDHIKSVMHYVIVGLTHGITVRLNYSPFIQGGTTSNTFKDLWGFLECHLENNWLDALCMCGCVISR